MAEITPNNTLDPGQAEEWWAIIKFLIKDIEEKMGINPGARICLDLYKAWLKIDEKIRQGDEQPHDAN